jgi:hypothetical protein
VVSSGLASTYRDLTSDEEKVAIRKIVPVGKDDAGYVDRLRNFADRESSATVQLLNPLYALVRQQRLRNQFESKGRDRRELRDGVRISRHCVRIRRLNQSTPRTRRFRAEATFRATAVWLLTKKELAWQARYNVACFDALRLAGPYVPPERRSGVKERALRNLDQAIRESAGELTRLWIEEDPDMAYFRGETDDDEQD